MLVQERKAEPEKREDLSVKGNLLYQNQIRSLVDTEENQGKFVLIDVDSGDWEMDANEIAASHRLRDRRPEARAWMLRVGLPYARRFGAGHKITG